MESIRAHKLASLCQRMPLDVFVCRPFWDGGESHAIRAVKADLVKILKDMDGRMNVTAEMTLEGIFIYLQ